MACPERIAGLPAGHFEIAPEAVTRAVGELLQQWGARLDDCAGILVCGQMGGTILCGPRGEPRSNYLSWRDLRVAAPLHATDGSTLFEALRGRLDAAAWSELGNELRPGSASALLAWRVAQGQTPRADERPCSLADFVLARLGDCDCVMHPTEAIGLLDLDRRTWHRAALRALIGAEMNWPDLSDTFTPVAHWTVRGRQIPCYGPLGDHQAALAGSGLAAGELSINISTGSQVSRLSRERAAGVAQTRAYFDDWLLQTVTHLPAGRSLEALVDFLMELPRRASAGDFDPWPILARAAEEAPESAAHDSLEVDLTFFSGPLGDEGAIRHVTLDNLRLGALVRAAWRGMARNYETCAEWLSPERQWERLVFSGGLAHKLDRLRHYTIERLRAPARVCVAAEDTLQGLLALALVLSGESASVVEAGQELNRSTPAE